MSLCISCRTFGSSSQDIRGQSTILYKGSCLWHIRYQGHKCPAECMLTSSCRRTSTRITVVCSLRTAIQTELGKMKGCQCRQQRRKSFGKSFEILSICSGCERRVLGLGQSQELCWRLSRWYRSTQCLHRLHFVVQTLIVATSLVQSAAFERNCHLSLKSFLGWRMAHEMFASGALAGPWLAVDWSRRWL